MFMFAATSLTTLALRGATYPAKKTEQTPVTIVCRTSDTRIIRESIPEVDDELISHKMLIKKPGKKYPSRKAGSTSSHRHCEVPCIFKGCL